ncbi:hypothetical protein GQ44DRAFT_822118 [Phaeosphaeriaceae sp. PMI808]|nr:hypothetical protein GQ44DRAFT_822118 [Phaeosphaeriaceae sp. PMI808]
MGHFDEQMSCFDVPPPSTRNGSEIYKLNLGYHVSSPTSVTDIGIRHDAAYTEASETIADNVSGTFEFVDWTNAGIDPISLKPPRVEPHAVSSTTSATLYSPVPHNAAAHGSPAPTTITPHLLQLWPTQSTRNSENEVYPAPEPASRRPSNHVTPQHMDKKRPLQEDITGGSSVGSGIASHATKKLRMLTRERRDDTDRVRCKGACLRCYVQKIKCSEGRPCTTCHALFNKNHNTRTLQWTACISSSLPELNVFGLGMSFFNERNSPSTVLTTPFEENIPAGHLQQLDLKSAVWIYSLLFEDEVHSESSYFVEELYVEVLRCTYGHRAAEVHPFIRKEKNPLHMLVQLNVILLGSPVLGVELVGSVGYLQKLRNVCAVVAFECLERALDRTTQATSSLSRQSALILQIALLLDQVLEMRGDIPAATISFASGKVFEEMREHLIQYLTYYLQRLVSHNTGCGNALLDLIRRAKRKGRLAESFWNHLSDLMPWLPFQRPPMLLHYADMGWNGCGDELGEFLHKQFASMCSISCN